jgi:ribosomal protein S17E
MLTVKRINEILAPEISNLSTEDFESIKSTINKLIDLGKNQ